MRRLRAVCASLLLLLLLLTLFVVGCDGNGPPPQLGDDDDNEPSIPFTLPDGFTGEEYLSGLDLPTSLAFPPDGSNRLFINELQSGRILIAQDGELLDEPFAQLETNVQGGFPVDGENGLLGITFDPNYETNGYVYVTYARRTDDGTFGAVARFTDVDNKGEDFTVLLDSIPCAKGHQIESLRFGPDGKLYVSAGDAYQQDAAQDTSAFVGKILRMNPDGSIPADNPFPNSYTYALGFRNCFDLVFDDADELYSTDNGPSFNDEMNKIVAGGNYGWPNGTGPLSDAKSVNPTHTWNEIVAPAGMEFYEGQQFPAAYRGKLFLVLFGATASTEPSDRSKRIQVVSNLDAESGPTFEDFAVYDIHGTGNPVDVTVGPEGNLYLSDIFQGRIFKISYAS